MKAVQSTDGFVFQDSIAFPRACALLNNWTGAGASLGPPRDWGTETCLVIDSITGVGDSTMAFANVKMKMDDDWKATGEAMKRRCADCHKEPRPLPCSPTDNLGMPPWRIKYGHPKLKLLRHIVYNLTRPEKSVLLRAPLSPAAGGLGLCRDEVFTDTADPHYQQILSAISAASRRLEAEKRFDMPGFRPNRHYCREMQRYGVLPTVLAADDPIDVYATDQAYWKSFWYQPPKRNADRRLTFR